MSEETTESPAEGVQDHEDPEPFDDEDLPEEELAEETDEEPEDPDEPGLPVGQVLTGGAALTTILGAVLFPVVGMAGLIVAGVAAVGGVVAYGVHRSRRNNRRPAWGKGLRGRRSSLFSGGRSGRLLGGRGGRLLGGRGAKLGGGKGARLGGKGGRLLGGRGAKLGGRGGRLFGGGKAGGRGLLGRARHGAASRLRSSRIGKKAGRAWSAAKSAGGGKGGLRRAAKAAAGSLRGHKGKQSRFGASVGGGALALIALLHGKWRAKKKTTDEDPAAAEASEPGQASDAQEPKPTRDPRSERGPSTRRARMSNGGFPLAAVAAEMNAAAAAHMPDDMWDVATELGQLAEVPEQVAMALRTYTARLESEYPLHEAVVEAIRSVYDALVEIVPLAEAVEPLFRQVHDTDLQRGEAPRTNEQAWDVGNRR